MTIFKILTGQQCDQIGRFFELLGNKISYKSSPKILVTFGLFKIMQNDLCYFLGNIGKIGQLFIPSSGHTDCAPIHKFMIAKESRKFAISFLFDKTISILLLIQTIFFLCRKNVEQKVTKFKRFYNFGAETNSFASTNWQWPYLI